MVAPKGFVYILTREPVHETLFRKRIFADVNVRNFKMRPRWTSHESYRTQTRRHRRGGCVKMKAEAGRVLSSAKRRLQP